MLWMRNLKLIKGELTCPVFPYQLQIWKCNLGLPDCVSLLSASIVFPLHSSLPAPLRNFHEQSQKRKKRVGSFLSFSWQALWFLSSKLSWDQVTCFLSHPSFSHGWDEQGEAESSKGTLLMSPHHNYTHKHQPLQQSSALFASSRGSLLGDAGRKQQVEYPQLALPDAWLWTIPRLLGSGLFCSGYWYETSWAPSEWHSPSSCKPVW